MPGPAAASVVLCCIMLLLLPENIAASNEVVWTVREKLRRSLKHILELTRQGPFFTFGVFGLQKLSCGFLSSRCLPPCALRAKVGSRREVLLCWTPRHPHGNMFHEETYVCSWRVISEDLDEPTQWFEQYFDENSFDESDSQRRWGVLLGGLPPSSCLRFRVCAVNRWGRGGWSELELEVDLPGSGRPPGSRTIGGRNEDDTACAGRTYCLQCRCAFPARRPANYADVLSRPVFVKGCEHGPFCARCRRSVSRQVLPSCVCHALIGTWREQPIA